MSLLRLLRVKTLEVELVKILKHFLATTCSCYEPAPVATCGPRSPAPIWQAELTPCGPVIVDDLNLKPAFQSYSSQSIALSKAL